MTSPIPIRRAGWIRSGPPAGEAPYRSPYDGWTPKRRQFREFRRFVSLMSERGGLGRDVAVCRAPVTTPGSAEVPERPAPFGYGREGRMRKDHAEKERYVKHRR